MPNERYTNVDMELAGCLQTERTHGTGVHLGQEMAHC